MRDVNSEDFRLAHKLAFMIGGAQHALGINGPNSDSLPLQPQLEAILQGAMENPAAVDEATYSIVYLLSQQPQANVDHEKLKQQPGGPLHQPKQEPQKQ